MEAATSQLTLSSSSSDSDGLITTSRNNNISICGVDDKSENDENDENQEVGSDDHDDDDDNIEYWKEFYNRVKYTLPKAIIRKCKLFGNCSNGKMKLLRKI